MTSIRSLSESLRDIPDIENHDRDRFVAIIHEESKRLTRLLDELLDISRLEAGTTDMVLESLSVDRSIRGALESVSSMIREGDIEVAYKPLSTSLLIRANGDRIRQVLINVLSNAVKYNTASVPHIEIVARRTNESVEIDIIDNGGGVSREDAATVFEKFARGSRAKRGHGAGLGLPISRAIMRAMGGDIYIIFAPEGSSFFRLRLAVA